MAGWRQGIVIAVLAPPASLAGVTIEKLPRSGADQLFLRLWPVAAQASPNRLPQRGSRTLIHVKALVEPVEELAAALHRYGGARDGQR